MPTIRPSRPELTTCPDSSNFQAGVVSEYSEVRVGGKCGFTGAWGSSETVCFLRFALLETAHEPGEQLPRHAHSHAYMTITVRGTYTEGCRGREDFCSPKSVRFLPAYEKHTNRFHQPTLCLNAELSPRLAERYAKSAATCVAELRSPFAYWIGQRLYAELGHQDNLTELAVLSAIIDLFSLFTWSSRSAENWPGPWLLRVRDYIEEHCTNAIRLDELSAVAGRHPAHLSSEFRVLRQDDLAIHSREARPASGRTIAFGLDECV